MMISTLTNGPEKVFVVVKAGEAIAKGEIVSWTANGTEDGRAGIAADAAADVPLAVGAADAAIASGDFGLVQCYGYDDDVVAYKHGTGTGGNLARGDILDIASAISGLSAVVPAANGRLCEASVASNGTLAAFGVPNFVAMETMASSAATATTTLKVFIRCM